MQIQDKKQRYYYKQQQQQQPQNNTQQQHVTFQGVPLSPIPPSPSNDPLTSPLDRSTSYGTNRYYNNRNRNSNYRGNNNNNNYNNNQNRGRYAPPNASATYYRKKDNGQQYNNNNNNITPNITSQNSSNYSQRTYRKQRGNNYNNNNYNNNNNNIPNPPLVSPRPIRAVTTPNFIQKLNFVQVQLDTHSIEYYVDTTIQQVLVNIKLNQCGLEDKHLSTLIEWFQQHFEVWLKNQSFTQSMPSTCILVTIELQDNYLATCHMLLTYLTHIVSIRSYRVISLKLWNNQITDEGCQNLAHYLVVCARCNLALYELHLSHNLITNTGVDTLFESINSYMQSDTKLTLLQPHREREGEREEKNEDDNTNALPNIIITPPDNPLWLRLEWNLIDTKPYIPCFQSYKQYLTQHNNNNIKNNNNSSSSVVPVPYTSNNPPTTETINMVDAPPPSTDFIDVAESMDDSEENKDIQEEDGEDDEMQDIPTNATTTADTNTDTIAANTTTTTTTTATIVPASPALSRTSTGSSLPAIPFPNLHICAAANRRTCTVRRCKFPKGYIHIHLSYFHLQHTFYKSSNLLSTLQHKTTMNRLSTSHTLLQFQSMRNENIEQEQQQQQQQQQASISSMPPSSTTAPPPSSSSSSPPIPSPPPSSHIQSITNDNNTNNNNLARPLLLFLDTNAVFNMITVRHEVKNFTWDNLYHLASTRRFGSCFTDINKHVYVILSAAVLNEMDIRKEGHKAREMNNSRSNSPNVPLSDRQKQRERNLDLLAIQIKQQFEHAPEEEEEEGGRGGGGGSSSSRGGGGRRSGDRNNRDINNPNNSFLARCKQLGFLETLSVTHGENLIHIDKAFLPSIYEPKQTQNDRKILNAALHWNSQLQEHGIVILITDDKNMWHLADSEDLPYCSLFQLDKALDRYNNKNSIWDSILLRKVLSSFNPELNTSLSNLHIQLSAPINLNIYEALERAVDIVQRAIENDGKLQDLEYAICQVKVWKGILAHQPQLLSNIRATVTPNASKNSCNTPHDNNLHRSVSENNSIIQSNGLSMPYGLDLFTAGSEPSEAELMDSNLLPPPPIDTPFDANDM